MRQELEEKPALRRPSSAPDRGRGTRPASCVIGRPSPEHREAIPPRCWRSHMHFGKSVGLLVDGRGFTPVDALHGASELVAAACRAAAGLNGVAVGDPTAMQVGSGC